MSAGHATDETTSKFLDIVHAKHPLRDDVRDMLIEFGAPPGPECIQPYELMEATFEQLPEDRRKHASTCERCRVVAAPAPPKFVAAAIREATRVRETPRPPVRVVSPAIATAPKRSSKWRLLAPIITVGTTVVIFLCRVFRKAVGATLVNFLPRMFRKEVAPEAASPTNARPI
jgi:hypothetical protein